MKIIADDKIPFLRGVFEEFAEIEYLPGRDIRSDIIKDADALITRTRTQCNETTLAGSNVKFIATATIGFDHIDVDYCNRHGIKWTNAPGCNSSSVAQYICSTLLNLSKRFDCPLSGKTLGVIGVGNVGAKVAALGEVLGMKVLLNDPPRAKKEGEGSFVDLKCIISEADIVTAHVPLNMTGPDQTFHLIDYDFLTQLKPSAWLINSSRGEVVETKSLKQAKRNNFPLSVSLDVWEDEPNIDRELLDMVDIATPHIAGYSLDGKANGTSMSVRAVSKFFDLPLCDWKPENMPVPENEIISFTPSSAVLEENLLDVVKRSYDVMSDDGRLRQDPSEFERLRGEYPLRREFPAHKVLAKTGSQDHNVVLEKLKKLGFEIFSKH